MKAIKIGFRKYIIKFDSPSKEDADTAIKKIREAFPKIKFLFWVIIK